MIRKHTRRLLVFLILLALTVTDVNLPGTVTARANQQAKISYEFNNKKAGYAAGTISVSNVSASSIKLYWCNKKGTKLKRDGYYYSELGTIHIKGGSGSYQVSNEYTAIPENAVYLKAYNGSKAVCAYRIPAYKRFSYGSKKYSFGSFSDVHYNRYILKGRDTSVKAFNKCLKFFDNANVIFAAGAGDLSNGSEEDSYIKYAKAVGKVDFPVYTTMGNHDVWSTYCWKNYVNTDIYEDGAKKRGILDISSDGYNFVYQNPEHKGQVFIFVCQNYWRNFGVIKPLMKDATVSWLRKMLAKYSNKTVYLYFHTYVAANGGDSANAVGNILAPNGYSYELTYPYGAKDEKILRRLLKKYGNVTMLSGHSHWSYAMQKYNTNLNIGSLGKGATLVHISSVGSPRVAINQDGSRSMRTLFPDISGARIERAGLSSEAMIVDVYKGYNVFNGVDTQNGKYLAYATYISKVGKAR